MTLDHPRGQSLDGVCDLRKVPWKTVLSLFGLEGLTQVANEGEARTRHVRSYAILEPQYARQGKKAAPLFAVVTVRHWSPVGTDQLRHWAEVNFFAVKDCSVVQTQVIVAGLSPEVD